MLCNSTDRIYMVFPSYLRHLRPLAVSQEILDVDPEYWPGFSGGGVLSHRPDLSRKRRIELQERFAPFAGLNTPYGTVLGNAEAERLRECVHVVQTDEWIPDLLIRMGFSKTAEPQVKTTVEHLEGVGDDIHLLIVPKQRSKLVPLFDLSEYWFGSFHVQVWEPHEVTTKLRSGIVDWFDNPNRRMYSALLSGGKPEAAWYLAVLTYVAEFWDLSEKGLDTMHVVAEISGKPNFRKHWTSNR